MKIALPTFLALLLFACSNTKEQSSKSLKDSTNLANALLPEEVKRDIFRKHVLSYADPAIVPGKYQKIEFNDFYKKYYPYDTLKFKNYKGLAINYYALNLEMINPHKLIYEKWFRILCIGRFYPWFSITIEKNNNPLDYLNSYHLKYETYLDYYTQFPQKILFSYTESSKDTLKYNSFFSNLQERQFLNRKPNFPDCGFNDPFGFIVEEIDNGRYNKVEIIMPWYTQCASDDDYYIIMEALKLVKNSTIYPALKRTFPPDNNRSIFNPYEHFEGLINAERYTTE